MKKIILSSFCLLSLISCSKKNGSASVASIVTETPEASTICSGTTILGVAGTANCSGGDNSSAVPSSFYFQAARLDSQNLDFDDLITSLWSSGSPVATREVATLNDAFEDSLLFKNNYSVIPNPIYESDGRYAQEAGSGTQTGLFTTMQFYFETIIAAKTATSRSEIEACGSIGDVDARIADCRTVNREWSFYSGAQYGQMGEGDWSLVTVVDDNGTKYEVWRDERTKLLWSDRATQGLYNWYRASGYSKPSADSIRETDFTSQPGQLDPVSNTIIQPTSPISVCPDVVSGKIAAGGGTYENYAPNPETNFKGNLNYSNGIIWKLPSIEDFKLADVNGIRKVLPNMDFDFWTSSSFSQYRRSAIVFYGSDGLSNAMNRYDYYNSVRCVGFEIR